MVKFCSTCGSEIPNKTNFCSHCGAEIEKHSAKKPVIANQSHKSNTKTRLGILAAIIILVLSLIFSFYMVTTTIEKNRFLGNWHVDMSSCSPSSGYNYAVLTYFYFDNDGTCIIDGSSREKDLWGGWHEQSSDPRYGTWELDQFTHKLTLSLGFGMKIICDYEFKGGDILYLSNYHIPYAQGGEFLSACYIKTS